MYERIKELCKLKGITINKLELDLDIARGSICRIDSSDPGVKKIKKIANYLETTIEYLLDGIEKLDDKEFGSEQAHLVSKIRKDTELSKALLKYFELSDAKKKHVVDLINLLGE